MALTRAKAAAANKLISKLGFYSRSKMANFARAAGRRAALRASKLVGNKLKKSKRKSLQMFGQLVSPVAPGNSLRLNANTQQLTNVLNTVDLLTIPQGTGIQQRESNRILLKGIKFNLAFVNDYAGTPAGKFSIMCNCALVTPKLSKTMNTGNFFRDYTTEDNIGFSSIGPWERHTRPINGTEYIVHWHKRFILNQNNTGIDRKIQMKRIIKYMKINKQVTYTNNGTTDVCDNNMFLLTWYGVGPGIVVAASELSVTFQTDIQIMWIGE